jgi:hypothetical protein
MLAGVDVNSTDQLQTIVDRSADIKAYQGKSAARLGRAFVGMMKLVSGWIEKALLKKNDVEPLSVRSQDRTSNLRIDDT